MDLKFSDEFNAIASLAEIEAVRTGHRRILPEHLLLGLIRHKENAARKALVSLGVDIKELKRRIDGKIFIEDALEAIPRVMPTKAAAKLVHAASYEALKAGSGELLATHILLAITRSEDNVCRQILNEMDINYEKLLGQLKSSSGLREDKTIRTPKMEEAISALGEQLTNLLGSSGSKTNYPS